MEQDYDLLADTPIFQVVRKHLKDSDFKPIQIRVVDWVTILAKKADEFVVVKQVRYGFERPFMEFPCGMVEPGEFYANAAKRELFEETGIVLTDAGNDMVKLGKIPVNPAFMTNHMHYFFVDLDTAHWYQSKPQPDKHEKIIVGSNDIEDLFYRAFNTEQDPSLETPSLMCTGLFLYDHYRKYPSRYKKGVPFDVQETKTSDLHQS